MNNNKNSCLFLKSFFSQGLYFLSFRAFFLFSPPSATSIVVSLPRYSDLYVYVDLVLGVILFKFSLRTDSIYYFNLVVGS